MVTNGYFFYQPRQKAQGIVVFQNAAYNKDQGQNEYLCQQKEENEKLTILLNVDKILKAQS